MSIEDKIAELKKLHSNSIMRTGSFKHMVVGDQELRRCREEEIDGLIDLTKHIIKKATS